MNIFVAVEGITYGPFSLEETREKIDSQELKPSDLVCYDNKSWVTVETLESMAILPPSRIIRRSQPAGPKFEAPTLVSSTGTTPKVESCPSCGSKEWKLVKFVYEQGQQNISLKGNTVGASIGSGGLNLGFGSTSSNGEIVSQLNERCKPPESRIGFAMGCLLVSCLIVAVIVRFASDSLIWALVTGVVTLFIGIIPVSLVEGKDKEYESKLAAWSKRRICSRCGSFFNP